MNDDFASARRALLADGSRRGFELARAHAELVDAWLAGLLGDEAGVALVAVGGHGRRELFPASDLDLVLVHRGRRDVGRVAERIWYPIWDAHLALDHSVRTPREAVAVARDDLKAALGLLDARLVAGDAALAVELAERSRRQWRDGARRNLAALDEMCQARHAYYGEAAFLLEPDVKEAKGGLRDLTALRALAAAGPFLGLSQDGAGAALAGADAALAGAAGVLAGVRVELHRRAGRALDRLLLQEQDGVAAALGYPDADVLMAVVAGAARSLAWAGDDARRRARSWLAGPAGRAVSADRPLGPGLVLRESEVHLGPGAAAEPVLTLILRAADSAARNDARLSRALLPTLVQRAEELGPGAPWPAEARQALVSLLGSGRPAVGILEDLDQAGLLVRILPEWAAVRNRPQRNAYHRYTVDRHLLEAAAGAAGMLRRVTRPDLLLVGALLHDLGKGYPGDHTDAGVVLMAEIAPRLGFDRADTECLVALVRHHLLLADVATRRDLADPTTIEVVAKAVGDSQTLGLLAALTEADSLATGESAWSAWKAGLVAELLERVGRALAGQSPPPLAGFPLERHQALMDRAVGGLVVVGEGDRLTVAGPDRPGLFSTVTGALALEGLAVLAADAWSGSWKGAGVAVSEHVVRAELGGPPDWASVQSRLGRLDGGGDGGLEEALAARARTYLARRPPASAQARPPEVRLDLDASTSATVVEVWASDELGLLHRLSKVISGLGYDIRHAKAQTLGHEVVDSFYVVGAGGAKVTEPGALDALEAALLAAVTGPGRQGSG